MLLAKNTYFNNYTIIIAMMIQKKFISSVLCATTTYEMIYINKKVPSECNRLKKKIIFFYCVGIQSTKKHNCK